MIGNILDNTTELCMIKYAFGEIFSSGGATLCKNPSDQTVNTSRVIYIRIGYMEKQGKECQNEFYTIIIYKK